MTLSIITLITVLSAFLFCYAECPNAECCYAECCYTECRSAAKMVAYSAGLNRKLEMFFKNASSLASSVICLHLSLVLKRKNAPAFYRDTCCNVAGVY
jgi:hypothetical protein